MAKRASGMFSDTIGGNGADVPKIVTASRRLSDGVKMLKAWATANEDNPAAADRVKVANDVINGATGLLALADIVGEDKAESLARAMDSFRSCFF